MPNSSFELSIYELDISLWFILLCDKRNRNDLADFIKNIPIDLIERIHQELENVL